jgi:circadian clock protein KaiC
MAQSAGARLSTGIEGLDEVLGGGLIPRRTYLLRGAPGVGKTLFGLHFLLAADDEADALFVALEESADDVAANAASVGFDTSGVEFLDLSPRSDFFAADRSYDVFTSDEGEDGALATSITDRIEESDPDRVVLDPATQLRYLAPDAYQFRKQVLSFVRFLRERDATLVLTSQVSETLSDDDLQFLTDGVVDLSRSDDTRSLRVPKFRGSDTRDGRHTFRITDGGITVSPTLALDRVDGDVSTETVPSGVPEVDTLLGGGLQRGTVTIVSGPTGVGKTTLGTQFMKEAAGRGERSVVYLFEEHRETFLQRSTGIGLPVRQMLDHGTLTVEEVEPLQRSAEAFAQDVRRAVENEGAEVVMLDGIDGYRMSLRGEDDDLTRQLHSLCRYLKRLGVTVILVDETGSITGEFQATSEKISYLADTIVFLRYIELDGELRKAIGVLKKRTSDFERTLRDFRITEYGLQVGEPLSSLRGVLRGTPRWVDDPDQSRDSHDDDR